MDIYAPIILCFIPFIAIFLLLKVLVDGISIIRELLACAIVLIALIPIVILQYFCGQWLTLVNRNLLLIMLYALVLNGLIEEGIKCVVLFLFPVKKVNAKHMYFYALLAGIFLGSFESVIYVLRAIQNANSRGELLLHMIYVRNFTSILIHGFCAGLLGLFVYGMKNKKPMWGAVVAAVLLHGLYDFFTVMPAPLSYFAYVTIALLLLENRIYYMKAKALDQELGKV